MSRHTRSKRNRQSRSAQGRRRVLGLGTGAGAVLAFGLGPWGVAPAAHADGLDVILDPIINSLSAFDPTLGADLSTLLGDFTSSGWLDSLGAGSPDFFCSSSSPQIASRCGLTIP